MRVRVDSAIVTLEAPLLVLTGQNGGNSFDQICTPYRDMKTAPSTAWETEIWSRCRRSATVANVAVTQTIVQYVQAKPGVNRQDFRDVQAKVTKLEQEVEQNGNRPLPPQKVDTNVGK
jgi:hypothetical protein